MPKSNKYFTVITVIFNNIFEHDTHAGPQGHGGHQTDMALASALVLPAACGHAEMLYIEC